MAHRPKHPPGVRATGLEFGEQTGNRIHFLETQMHEDDSVRDTQSLTRKATKRTKNTLFGTPRVHVLFNCRRTSMNMKETTYMALPETETALTELHSNIEVEKIHTHDT